MIPSGRPPRDTERLLEALRELRDADPIIPVSSSWVIVDGEAVQLGWRRRR